MSKRPLKRKTNGGDIAPSVIHTQDCEKDLCDGLVREYTVAMQTLNRAQAEANRALGLLRRYGDMVGARMGYGTGEWILFDKDTVIDKALALQRNVPPGAFNQPEVPEPPPASTPPLNLPEETTQ